MNMVYVSLDDNRSIAYSSDVFNGNSYQAPPPPGDWLGRAMFNRDAAKWELDPPYVRTHEDDVRDAVQRQKTLIDEAMQSISIIQLKLQAGRKLTVAETAKLDVTLDYIDEVTAIDTSAAPNIVWPYVATSDS